MNSRKILLLLTLPFITSPLQSQEANVWYFGDGIGLDFTMGFPQETFGGQTSEYGEWHTEGSATICDQWGDILFYSNGSQVWNRNHEVMPNGDLVGHHSATHAALIIPIPGSEHKFYLFVTDSFMYEPQIGPHYYIVDMCLDDGLGDIDMAHGAQELHPEFTEKMAITRHANGTDFWLITHITLSNEFRAFPVTANGIGSPISSFAGSVHEGNTSWNEYGAAIGQMKVAPNGEYLALAAANGANFAELFVFDNATGQIAFILSIDQNIGGYGVAFSPNSNKLYLRNLDGIFQLDLTWSNADSILESMVEMEHEGTNSLSGLQLGPDGRKYAFAHSNTAISCIWFPDEDYPACTLDVEAIPLTSTGVSYTFPSFMDSFDLDPINPDCNSTGVNELTSESKVYPNPATDVIYLDLSEFGTQMVDIQLINSQGQKIYHGPAISSSRTQLACGEFARGIYTIIVSDGQVQLLNTVITLN